MRPASLALSGGNFGRRRGARFRMCLSKESGDPISKKLEGPEVFCGSRWQKLAMRDKPPTGITKRAGYACFPWQKTVSAGQGLPLRSSYRGDGNPGDVLMGRGVPDGALGIPNAIQGAISDQVQRSYQRNGDQRHHLHRWRHQCRYHRASGVTITRSTFLTGGFLNSNLISGAPTGIVVSDSTIHGAISDSGRILATGVGILVSGGIVSGGIQVAAAGKIVVSNGTAIDVERTTTFAGGISNSGVVSAGLTGMNIFGVSSFAGGIGNSGTIFAGLTGMNIFGITSFSGGINNKGRIAAALTGFNVFDISTFAGGIGNSGTISAGLTGMIIFGISKFAGNISNGGMISAGSRGFDIFDVSIFAGNITNSGKISAGKLGIQINRVATFAGGVTNSGTLSAGHDGIDVGLARDGVFTGGVVDSGTIFAGDDGILVNSGSVISGGIWVSSKGKISAESSGIVVDKHRDLRRRHQQCRRDLGGSTPRRHPRGVRFHLLWRHPQPRHDRGGELWRCRLERDGVHWRHHQQRSYFERWRTSYCRPKCHKLFRRNRQRVRRRHQPTARRHRGYGHFHLFRRNRQQRHHPVGRQQRHRCFLVSTFSGAITNSGRISAKFIGIDLFAAIAFGTSMPGVGIVNIGKISAGTGIDIGQMSTFSGGISNSGTISAGNAGILVGYSLSTQSLPVHPSSATSSITAP